MLQELRKCQINDSSPATFKCTEDPATHRIEWAWISVWDSISIATQTIKGVFSVGKKRKISLWVDFLL